MDLTSKCILMVSVTIVSFPTFLISRWLRTIIDLFLWYDWNTGMGGLVLSMTSWKKTCSMTCDWWVNSSIFFYSVSLMIKLSVISLMLLYSHWLSLSNGRCLAAYWWFIYFSVVTSLHLNLNSYCIYSSLWIYSAVSKILSVPSA